MPYGHIIQYTELVKQAQNKRIKITKKQQREISKMYSAIAKDLKKQLDKYSPETLTYRWLKDYAKSLKTESKRLYRAIEKQVKEDIQSTAGAVAEAERAFYDSLAPELSDRFRDVFSKIPRQVTDELMSGGIYRDFTGLSERIWNYRRKYDRDIQWMIRQGITAQKSAFELSKDLEIYLDPKAAKPFDWSKVYPGVNKKVDYSAQRLARTSVTHAYQLSFQRATKDNPFVEKYRWLSSNSARVCPLCAARNGQLFEKDSLPLDHPSGMCTVVAVISKSYEEIANELADWAAGKQNLEIDWWLNQKHINDTLKDINITPIKITQKAIDNIRQPESDILSPYAIRRLQEAQKELLRYIENDAAGVEALIELDLQGNELGRYKGGKMSVKASKRETDFISIHNHPSGDTFSLDDLSIFAVDENMKILCVVGNNGTVYSIEKTEEIDFAGLYHLLKEAIKAEPNFKKGPQQYVDFMEKILKGAEQYGYKYRKG